MNFLVKTVLRRIINRYLDLDNNVLDLQSGIIKLPKGNIRHEAINLQLAPLKIKIVHSEYCNLTVHIPLVEIMSRPIKINIDLLELVIEQGNQQEATQSSLYQQLITTQTLIQSSSEQTQLAALGEGKEGGAVPEGQSPTYIMSLLTRLLYNLELQIGKVLITCQLAQPNSEFKLKASLSINSLSLRNTVLVLGANIVKKTLTLGQLAIVVTLHNSVTLPNALQHTSTVLNADNALKTQKIGSGVLCVSFQQSDLNICLDYSLGRLAIITVANGILLRVSCASFEQLHKVIKEIHRWLQKQRKAPHKQSQFSINSPVRKRRKTFSDTDSNLSHSPKASTLNVSLDAKISTITLQIPMLSCRSTPVQFKLKRTQTEISTLFTISQINIELMDGDNQMHELIVIKYLQDTPGVKVFSQFEDSMLKGCLIRVEQRKENKVRWVVKVDNCGLNVHIDKLNLLMDMLEKHRADIVKLYQDLTLEPGSKNIAYQSNIFEMSPDKPRKEQSESASASSLVLPAFQVTIYRLCVSCQYNNLSLQIYGTIEFEHRRASQANSNTFQLSSHQLCLICNQYVLCEVKESRVKIDNALQEVVATLTNVVSELSMQLVALLVKECAQLVADGLKHAKTITWVVQQIWKIDDTNKFKQMARSEVKDNPMSQSLQSMNEMDRQGLLSPQNFNSLIEINDGQLYLPKQKDSKSPQQSHNALLLQLRALKLYLRIDEISLCMGQLLAHSSLHNFITIFRLNITNSILTASRKNCKLKTELMATILSPDTLQQAPLCNDIHLAVCLSDTLTLRLKNDVVLLVQESYINIFARLLSQQVCSRFTNNINYPVTVLQPILLQTKPQQSPPRQYSVQISPNRSEIIFWTSPSLALRLQIQHTSFEISLKDITKCPRQPCRLHLKQYLWQLQYELSELQDDEGDYCYILKILLNAFDNICEVILCSRFVAVAFQKPYSLVDNRKLGKCVQIPAVQSLREVSDVYHYGLEYKELTRDITNWESLADLLEEHPRFSAKDNQNQRLKLLVTEQDLQMYGIEVAVSSKLNKPEQVIPADNQQPTQNQLMPIPLRFSRYLLATTHLLQTRILIMPFLIIKNSLDTSLTLQISNRKTNESEKVIILPFEERAMCCCGQFDYYSRQLTYKAIIQQPIDNITVGNSCDQAEPIVFESEPVYFSTYVTVQHKFESLIQLRPSLANYGSNAATTQSKQPSNRQMFKSALVVSESIYLKTKMLTFDHPFAIYNNTPFRFMIKKINSHIQPNKAMTASTSAVVAEVLPNCLAHYPVKLREEDIIAICFNEKAENTISITFGELRNSKLLSYNFCKLFPTQQGAQHCRKQRYEMDTNDDNYYNILIRAELNTLSGIECLLIDNFIKIVNLFKNCPSLSIGSPKNLSIAYNQSTYLPLPATSMQTYNNKALPLTDVSTLYTEIFLSPKITNSPLMLYIGTNSLSLSSLLQTKTEEVTIQGNRYIFSLIRELNSKRITFYCSEGIYTTNGNYTFFTNRSKQCFLMVADGEYAHHFSGQQQPVQGVRQKVFINMHSFNAMVGKQDYQILMCDQKQKHLEKTDKEALRKTGIKLRLHQFDTVTLLEGAEGEMRGDPRRKGSQDLFIGKRELARGKEEQSENIAEKTIAEQSIVASEASLVSLNRQTVPFEQQNTLQHCLSPPTSPRNVQKQPVPIDYSSPKISRKQPEYSEHATKSGNLSTATIQPTLKPTQPTYISPVKNPQVQNPAISFLQTEQPYKSTIPSTSNLPSPKHISPSNNAKQQSSSMLSKPLMQLSTCSIQLRLKIFQHLHLTFTIQKLHFRCLEQEKLDCLVNDISIKNELSADRSHILRVPEQSYVLIEGATLNGKFVLIKNLFVRCKHIIVNVENKLSYQVLAIVNNLTLLTKQLQMFLANKSNPNTEQRAAQHCSRTRLQENIETDLLLESKRSTQWQKLKSYVQSSVLLVRNFYIDEVHLSLTMELEGHHFSNVIILPNFQIKNRFLRVKTLTTELRAFYITNLIAKFPKLSFLLQNLRNPISLIRMFFGMREALKDQQPTMPVIDIGHQWIPLNPYLFSLQRWNFIVMAESNIGKPEPQTLICSIAQSTGKGNKLKYLAITNLNILLISNMASQDDRVFQVNNYALIELEKVTLRNINGAEKKAELVLRLKKEKTLEIVTSRKACLNIYNAINRVLM